VGTRILLLDDKTTTTQTDYLCEAAAAIAASIKDASVAMPLATSLLLPFAMVDGNRTILAAICEMIGHHLPSSDNDASTLLSLCQPLVEMKSLHALETCSSLCLARFRHHTGLQDYNRSIQWLLRGVMLEKSANQMTWGSCYKTLATWCLRMSTSLLQATSASVGGAQIDLEYYLGVKEAVQTLSNEPDAKERISEVQLLCTALAIFEQFVQSKSGNSCLSKDIVRALELTMDRSTKVRSSVAHPRLHEYLLRTAQYILQSESDANASGPAFQLEDLAVLSESLLGVEASSTMSKPEIREMGKLLSEARARAYMFANKQMKQPLARPLDEVSKLRSVDIFSMSMADREKMVASMLDF
jgi:hypothetical protein